MSIGYVPGGAEAGAPALEIVAESTVSAFIKPDAENSVPVKTKSTPEGFVWSSAVIVSVAGVTVSAPGT